MSPRKDKEPAFPPLLLLLEELPGLAKPVEEEAPSKFVALCEALRLKPGPVGAGPGVLAAEDPPAELSSPGPFAVRFWPPGSRLRALPEDEELALASPSWTEVPPNMIGWRVNTNPHNLSEKNTTPLRGRLLPPHQPLEAKGSY